MGKKDEAAKTLSAAFAKATATQLYVTPAACSALAMPSARLSSTRKSPSAIPTTG